MHLVSSLQELKAAWQRGAIILHPTDTIPGLSFRPDLEKASQAFQRLKGRPEGQTCIVFRASPSAAFQSWQALPAGWQQVLTELWPGPLSVVWQAADDIPKTLVREDGSLAIRIPALANEHLWLSNLLSEFTQSFPSSSVNRSGEPSATQWQEALEWLAGTTEDCVAPDWVQVGAHFQGKPSTLIAIRDQIDHPQPYRVLRSGAFDEKKIDLVIGKICEGGGI